MFSAKMINMGEQFSLPEIWKKTPESYELYVPNHYDKMYVSLIKYNKWDWCHKRPTCSVIKNNYYSTHLLLVGAIIVGDSNHTTRISRGWAHILSILGKNKYTHTLRHFLILSLNMFCKYRIRLPGPQGLQKHKNFWFLTWTRWPIAVPQSVRPRYFET